MKNLSGHTIFINRKIIRIIVLCSMKQLGFYYSLSVVDPGFPVGGAEPLGGADLQCGHFLMKMYAKTQGWGAPAVPPDPPSLLIETVCPGSSNFHF